MTAGTEQPNPMSMGMNALPDRAEAAEKPVHKEGRPRHVTGILQQGQKQEQQRDLRQKVQDAADAGDNPVRQQADKPGRRVNARQNAGQPAAEIGDEKAETALEKSARRPEGDREHRQHRQEEDGQRQKAVRHDGVDAVRRGRAAAPRALPDGGCHDFFYVAVAGVGGERFPVPKAGILTREALGIGSFIAIEFQLLQDKCVALQELDSRPVLRQAGRPGVIPEQQAKATVKLPCFAVVEAVRLGRDPEERLTVRRAEEGDQVFARPGRNGHHRDPKGGRQRGGIRAVAPSACLVHEVERHDHRPLQLQELHRQVQVAFQVRRVDDVDDGVRLFAGPCAQDIVPGDDFLQRIRRERINAGQVDNQDLTPVQWRGPLLFFHRNARPVSNILTGARKSVEQRRLAGVGVAGERQADGAVLLRSRSGRFRLRSPAYAPEHLRVGPPRPVADPGGCYFGPRRRQVVEDDLRGVVPAEGQLVAAQGDLDGVAQGRDTPDRHGGAGGQAHINKAPFYGTRLVPDGQDDPALTRQELLKCFLCRHRTAPSGRSHVTLSDSKSP